MRRRSKVKLCLIPNEASRRTTFKKRKIGIMKKLNELTTLCGVKACAIIRSPHQSEPEVWPSPQGVQEVVSKFMEYPVSERTKLMRNQETYLLERIEKEQKKLKKVVTENRELHLQQFMFDCFLGKMSEYYYEPRDLQDLQYYLDNYNNQLHHRIEVLTRIGESSSFHHLAGINPLVTPNPHFDFDAAAVGFYDHIQYQNMNQNEQELVQQHFFDHLIQYQNMNMNQNLMEMVPYQNPNHFYDHIQHGMYQNMNLGSHQNVNQYPSEQESFRNQMVEHPQQMDYEGEHSNMSLVDDHYNNYQSPLSTEFSTTNL